MPLYRKTPCVRSTILSQHLGIPVWLKMENLQPTGSFKLRGLSQLAQHLVRRGARRLVASSGGNAGIAVAYASTQLNVPCDIFVPQSTTPTAIVRMQDYGAHIHPVAAPYWSEAHEQALRFVESCEGAAYLHPFDHPQIWKGHATMMRECQKIMASPPDAVVISVGGGGLLCGVVQGMHQIGWQDVPVYAVEPTGAASYAAALQAQKPVAIDVKTVAVTLAAKQVCQASIDWAQKHTIRPLQVSDAEAVDACYQFADHHRMLVEPACGAALAPIYQRHPELLKASSVLVIVCGGAGISVSQLLRWKEEFPLLASASP